MGSFGAFGGALTGDFGLLGAEPSIKRTDLGAEGLLGNFADDPEAVLAGSLYILIGWRSVNHPTYHQHSRIPTICSLRRLLFFSARSQAGCNGSGRCGMHRAALLRRGRAWSYRTQGVGVLLPLRAQAFFLFSFFPEKSIECDINVVLPAPTYRIAQSFDVGQSPTATKDWQSPYCKNGEQKRTSIALKYPPGPVSQKRKLQQIMPPP